MKIYSAGMLAMGSGLLVAGAFGGAGAIMAYALGGMPQGHGEYGYDPKFAIKAMVGCFAIIVFGSLLVGSSILSDKALLNGT